MGQFLKQTLASLIGSLTALLLLLTLGASGLALLFVSTLLKEDGARVKDKTVLVFDLATQISDVQPQSTLNSTLSGTDSNAMTLRQVLDTLEKAAADERIVGLLLDGTQGEGNSGYAQLAEIRRALEQFQAAGKQIIAYDTAWEESSFYLSSLADTVIVHPLGTMTIDGFSSQVPLFVGALEKYGIDVQVVRAGSYKSAVEPFTQQSLSPESREQTEELLGDLWQEFVSTISGSREITPQQLQSITDTQGLLDAESALAAGLVDRLAYLDEVIAELKELTDVTAADRSFRQLSLSAYSGATGGANSSDNKIAVVYADGAIVGGEGTLGQVGSDRFAQILRKLRRDRAVKAVVLRINSPGGGATASDIILREVQLLGEEKPIVVSMGNVAASGGYWVAMGADEIFAEASTITGSIGVFGLLPNIQELANNNGITWDVVKTGRLADINTVLRPKSEQELAIYQQYVDQTYNTFLNKVAEFRNLPKERVAEIAQGRVWSGTDAQQIGLVDRLGGLEAAVESAAEKADLDDDWELSEYPQQRRLGEIFARLLTLRSESATLDPLSTELKRFKADLAFQLLSDPQGIYARLPFNFRVD
ncbi:MAG: signal peptide peptidase SppA [Cyanophyceae cyanobacterium]